MSITNRYAKSGITAAKSQRQVKIDWEAARIAEGRACLEIDGVVASDLVDAWIDSLGTDHELPLPHAVRC